jgi:hypothetical protein
VLAIVVIGVVCALGYRHFFPSFEAQLASAVDAPSCEMDTRNFGFYDDGATGRGTTRQFAAFCTTGGPSVEWLSYASDAKMHAAIAASQSALAGTALCENNQRAQLLDWLWNGSAFPGVDRALERLCRSIGARMVRS